MALPRKLEEYIFSRDNFTCCLCHKEFPTKYQINWKAHNYVPLSRGHNYLVVDHINPKIEDNTEGNLQALCACCNGRKAGRSMFTLEVMSAVQLLGRPVVSYPFLTRLIGLNASVFISQLLYWTPRTNKYNEGWIFKTSVGIREETGLSYKEQLTAREKLVESGLLEEHYDRENHRMLFRIIPKALVNFSSQQYLPEEHMPEEHMPEAEVAPTDTADGTFPKGSSYKERESTSESTTEITVDSTQTPVLVQNQECEKCGSTEGVTHKCPGYLSAKQRAKRSVVVERKPFPKRRPFETERPPAYQQRTYQPKTAPATNEPVTVDEDYPKL